MVYRTQVSDNSDLKKKIEEILKERQIPYTEFRVLESEQYYFIETINSREKGVTYDIAQTHGEPCKVIEYLNSYGFVMDRRTNERLTEIFLTGNGGFFNSGDLYFEELDSENIVVPTWDGFKSMGYAADCDVYHLMRENEQLKPVNKIDGYFKGHKGLSRKRSLAIQGLYNRVDNQRVGLGGTEQLYCIYGRTTVGRKYTRIFPDKDSIREYFKYNRDEKLPEELIEMFTREADRVDGLLASTVIKSNRDIKEKTGVSREIELFNYIDLNGNSLRDMFYLESDGNIKAENHSRTDAQMDRVVAKWQVIMDLLAEKNLSYATLTQKPEKEGMFLGQSSEE